MEQWNGNDVIFRGYFFGKGKAPERGSRIKGEAGYSFAEVGETDCFGAVMREGFIDISFDDPAMSKKFLEMAEENQWLCMVLKNPDNGHIHTFWRNSRNRITKKSAVDQKLAVGLVADIHGGDTYIPLCVDGVGRFPPKYDIFDGEDYQEVPEELLPVNTKIDLWDLKGGNRNNALSGMAMYLVHNGHFTKEQIRRVLTNTNSFVFADPLGDAELDTILREETFKDLEEVPKLNTLNAAELFRMDIKPVEFIIERLIPVGMVILASPPKYGKSYMCLDMALSVSMGRDFLGFHTHQCRVLYLSLEDRFDRLKQRMNQITGGERFPELLELQIESQTLDSGLIEQLEGFLQEHPDTKLVIIDTFIKICGEAKRNESAYGKDSREAGVIKKFADQHDIAVMLVTHTRKGIDPTDPFVNITGTFGIAGVADDMIVLTKEKRGDLLTKMSVTGRDVQYEEYPLIFDKDRGKWMRQGDSYELAAAKFESDAKWAAYQVGNVRKTILKLLEENGGAWSGFCKAIIDKSKEYGTPIAMTSNKLGIELTAINGFLYRDKIAHTEISKGTAAKKHKFEIIKYRSV